MYDKHLRYLCNFSIFSSFFAIADGIIKGSFEAIKSIDWFLCDGNFGV